MLPEPPLSLDPASISTSAWSASIVPVPLTSPSMVASCRLPVLASTSVRLMLLPAVTPTLPPKSEIAPKATDPEAKTSMVACGPVIEPPARFTSALEAILMLPDTLESAPVPEIPVPPCRPMLPNGIEMSAFRKIPPVAFRARSPPFSTPLLSSKGVAVSAALTKMSRSAFSVSALPLPQLIGLPKVMSPGSPKSGGVEVEMVTLLTASCASRVAGSTSPPVAIRMLVGSSNRVPVDPATADRSAVPAKRRRSLPETSANPPSPPSAPPRAVIWPSKVVSSSDQMTTRPPSPRTSASAEMRVPASTKVVRACASSPPPLRSPPARITPPPSRPLASSSAPASLICAPVIWIAPPAWGRCTGTGEVASASPSGALASSRPETSTVPPGPPPSTISPDRPLTVRASATPERFTA